VQVMPAGIARIDQPLAAARAGRQQAEAQRREVADQVVAGVVSSGKGPTNGVGS
jgi:hypothetical protein